MLACSCISHNGFLTRKGYIVKRQGEKTERGLTRGVKGVILDMSVSVSGLRRDEDTFVDEIMPREASPHVVKDVIDQQMDLEQEIARG